MGKTKVMVHALGATAETEYAKGLSALTKYVSGEVGLLFTSRSEAEVKAFFAGFREVDFARAGNRAERGFRIPKGVELRTASGVEGMEGEEDPIPVSMEPTLRKLGVPTRIVKGKVVLEESGADEGEMEEDDGEGGNGYVVCRPGDILDSRQTTLLKIFGVRMAEFRIGLKAVWEKASGTVREIGAMELDGMATDS